MVWLKSLTLMDCYSGVGGSSWKDIGIEKVHSLVKISRNAWNPKPSELFSAQNFKINFGTNKTKVFEIILFLRQNSFFFSKYFFTENGRFPFERKIQKYSHSTSYPMYSVFVSKLKKKRKKYFLASSQSQTLKKNWESRIIEGCLVSVFLFLLLKEQC